MDAADSITQPSRKRWEERNKVESWKSGGRKRGEKARRTKGMKADTRHFRNRDSGEGPKRQMERKGWNLEAAEVT